MFDSQRNGCVCVCVCVCMRVWYVEEKKEKKKKELGGRHILYTYSFGTRVISTIAHQASKEKTQYTVV